eukprot:5464243-Prymnesium_polylepis.1
MCIRDSAPPRLLPRGRHMPVLPWLVPHRTFARAPRRAAQVCHRALRHPRGRLVAVRHLGVPAFATTRTGAAAGPPPPASSP